MMNTPCSALKLITRGPPGLPMPPAVAEANVADDGHFASKQVEHQQQIDGI